MSWLDKFKKKRGAEPEPPAPTEEELEIEINQLGAEMGGVIPRLEKGNVDLELVCAKLADLFRDMDRDPVPSETAMAELQGLNLESQRRLAIAVSYLEDPATRKAFSKIAGLMITSQAMGMLQGFAKDHHLLTIEILNESPLRREEFIRHFIALLKCRVANETPSASHDRLERLDYRKLLAAAEKAKTSASERTAYLKKLQEEQERKLGRRSKF